MFKVIATVIFIPCLIASVDPVRVKVEQGWLEGEELVPVTGEGQYYSFKGIPYAAPPVGKLRFQPPSPGLPWNGTRKAFEHGSVCTQHDIFKNLTLGSEDCLFLNVYSPNLNPEELQTVMVYIHGGGFEIGSGNVDNYGPDFLVKFGVVLVTLNYRLDALGFLSLESKDIPGNAGMKDQVAALKWVQDNIKNFGGNPNDVTIFGQSAGGSSVTLHMASPISKGLFKRAISMSGVATSEWSLSYESRRRAFVLGKKLGLNTNDEKQLLEFLRNVPAEELVRKNPSVLTSEDISVKVLKMYHFVPVVEKDFGDEHFITEDVKDIFVKGNKFNDVDLMIGHTNEETVGDLTTFENLFLELYAKYEELLVPTSILYTNAPKDILKTSDLIRDKYFSNKPIGKETIRQFLDYLNDVAYHYDIHNFIQLLHKASKSRIYVYRFSGFSERNIYGKLARKYNITGASHGDDTVYLFDPKSINLPLEKESKEYKMIMQLCLLFTNFAKYGDPTPHSSTGIKWPVYNKETEEYLEISEQLLPGKDLDKLSVAGIEFWKNVHRRQ